MQQNTEKHRHAIKYEEVRTPTNDGACLLKRLPVRRVAAIARRGMVVLVGGDYAKIIDVTSDIAVLKLENGAIQARYWSEVSLDNVRPAPDELPKRSRRA